MTIGTSEQPMAECGCVHGRFQPFHNEHLEYVLAAKKKCRYLLVGITRYDHQPCQLGNSHRGTIAANPFNYRERSLMIKEALLGAGLQYGEFDITPFPIDNPESLSAFVPKSFICYTTVRERWNIEKVHILKSEGYKVDVLWNRCGEEKISGTAIRQLIRQKNSHWKSLVPAETVASIEASIHINPMLWCD